VATKWEINKAVKASSLPSPSRLIMFALSDSADATTGVIPDEHTPSLGEIAKWTGLDKATVTRHLGALDRDGWVERCSPTLEQARTQHVRTTYQLHVGHGAQDTKPGAENTMPNGADRTDETGMAHSAPSQSGQDNIGLVQPAPRHGAQDTKGMVQAAPVLLLPDHYQISPDHSSSKSATAKAAKRQRRPKSKPNPPPDRPDVERICEHLADRVEANGSIRPTVTAKWRESARLLLDRDGRTEDQVMKAIDWCQADEFWCANIKSMPTLRKQYDTLRLHAKRPNGRASPRSGLVEHNGMLLKPETVADLERTRRFEAMDAANPQPAIGAAP
jgi:DNA-binding transcriptional ArsR family regulator